jgi:hypothetical protein
MKPSQFIKVQVLDIAEEEWVDITNGILSIDTTTGSDVFQGFWDQPDTGQFVITTRGATSDPNFNPLITSNSVIKVFVDSPGLFEEDVFYGFITDVGVKYNKNDKQIVTINGTDLIGYLNRLIVTQEFIDTNIIDEYPDLVVPVDYLINYATYALAPELQDIFYIRYENIGAFNTLAGGGIGGWNTTPPPTAKVKVNPGDTLYDLITLGMSSGLMRYECRTGTEIYFLPYYKNDPFMFSESETQMLSKQQYYALTNEDDPLQVPEEFEPDEPKAFFTYRGITLNNGLNKMINQVSVNNIDPATNVNTIIDPLSSEIDLTTYGPAELNASTSFTTTINPFWLSSNTVADQSEYFQSSILFDQASPKTLIETITVDMAKYFAEGIDIPDNGASIWVQHRLDNDEYITGFYKIAGIKHQITESDWTADFILRSSEYISILEGRPKTPILTLTADEEPNEDGYYDTATNFTLTIDNYTSEDLANIESIEWFVNYL